MRHPELGLHDVQRSERRGGAQRHRGARLHKTHGRVCDFLGQQLEAQTADHWVRRNVRGGSAQKLDWLVVEEITQLDMALWADLACVGLNADVKFLLLLGDFRLYSVQTGLAQTMSKCPGNLR